MQRSLQPVSGVARTVGLTSSHGSVASTLGGRRGSLAKAKMEHGPLGPGLGSERVCWLPPLPMGHAPAAARSRRASANPLLTYNQPIGNCQTAVREIFLGDSQ